MKPLLWVRTYVLAYPVLLPLATYLTWLAGRWSLGHWPRPGLDDPKSIGTLVSLMHGGTLLVATAGMGLFLAGWLVLLGVAVRRPEERPALMRVSGWAALAFALAVGLLRWDPLSVGNWLAD